MLIYPCFYCGDIHRVYPDAYLCITITCSNTGYDFIIKGRRTIRCHICDKKLGCLGLPIIYHKDLIGFYGELSGSNG